MGQREVTREEWAALGMPFDDREVPGHPKLCVDPKCPVARVNLWDVVEYLNRRSAAEGLPACYSVSGCQGAPGGAGYECERIATAGSLVDCPGYRLPTSAEWEHAARGGTRTAFWSGDPLHEPVYSCEVEPALEGVAWYCGNAQEQAHAWPQPRANPWGLLDVHGNLAEMVSSFWSNDLLSEPQEDLDARLDRSPRRDDAIEVRGGSFLNEARDLWVAARTGIPVRGAGARDPMIGFRVARTVVSP